MKVTASFDVPNRILIDYEFVGLCLVKLGDLYYSRLRDCVRAWDDAEQSINLQIRLRKKWTWPPFLELVAAMCWTTDECDIKAYSKVPSDNPGDDPPQWDYLNRWMFPRIFETFPKGGIRINPNYKTKESK